MHLSLPAIIFMASIHFPSAVSAANPPPIDHRGILLDLDSLRSEAAPEATQPTSIIHVYRGVQSLVVRRALGYYHRLFDNSLRARWEGTNETIMNMERQEIRFYEAEADLQSGGRWWDRTWRQSLVPSRGGVPYLPEIIEVGKDLEVLSLGEASLTNDGRITLGDMSVYLHERWSRLSSSVSVGIEHAKTPHGNLWTGDGWSLSARPTIRLRLPDSRDFRTAISSASIEFTLYLYPGKDRILWAFVNVRLNASPRDGDYGVSGVFEIVRW